jgi:hypothetical protein
MQAQQVRAAAGCGYDLVVVDNKRHLQLNRADAIEWGRKTSAADQINGRAGGCRRPAAHAHRRPESSRSSSWSSFDPVGYRN